MKTKRRRSFGRIIMV